MAAIACAPPALNTWSMPDLRAATNTAASTVPLRAGGVHITRTGHAAMAAGTASMMAVEGSGADPAGTYRPTAWIGTLKRSHTTPGAVSTRSGAVVCAAWNCCTFAIARSKAALCTAFRARSAAANSAAVTRSEARRAWSNFSVRVSTAESPSRRTASMMSCAAAATCAALPWEGLRKAWCCSAAVSDFQCRMRMMGWQTPLPLRQHFLDRQHQDRGGARALQLLERFPKYVFTAHRVHRHPVPAAFERNDRRCLAARQQLRDRGQCRARRVQHDVLAALDLLHAVDAHEQAPRPLLFLRGDRHRRANQRGLAFEHDLRLAQVVRRQRRAGRHQVADQIRPPEPRRYLHGAGQDHDLGGNAALRQETSQDVRIRRRDAFALQRLGAAVVEPVRHGDAQFAAPEIQGLHRLEQRRDVARRECQAFLLDHVQPDQP